MIDRDFMKVPEAELKDIQPLQTIVNGKIVTKGADSLDSEGGAMVMFLYAYLQHHDGGGAGGSDDRRRRGGDR